MNIIDEINKLQKELHNEELLSQELNDAVFQLDAQLNNIKAAKIFGCGNTPKRTVCRYQQLLL